MKEEGVFIVVEGADGSGKTTQFKLLSERLRAVGYDIEVFDFPQYENPSSHFVRSYLNGIYGPASDVSPYTASIFYALDRYEAAPRIRKALEDGKIVLSNRYVGSNMAHQGGKFTNPVQQRGFFVWEDGLEYEMLGIPRPTTNFFLRVPAEVSYKLISKKAERSYTKDSHDEHEKDINHLRHSIKTYDTLCELFPKDFIAIECVKDDKLLSIAAINDLIWAELKPKLPEKPPHKPKSAVVNFNQPKTTLKDEPKNTSNSIGKTSNDINFELKNISLLAAQSLRIIPGITCKVEAIEWNNGKINYFTPTDIPKAIAAKYKNSMENIGNLHIQMQDEVQKYKSKHKSTADFDPLTNIIPLAALTTVNISATPDSAMEMISTTFMSPHEEIRWISKQLSLQAKNNYPEQFKDIKEISEEGIFNDIIAKLARDTLSEQLSAEDASVNLLEAHPRNEFDLIVDSIYPYSNLSKIKIKEEIDGWSYVQKEEAFSLALAQAPSILLENAYYQWNVIDDQIALSEVKEQLPLENIQTQQPTPRFGYNVPEILETIGIEDLFIECFDESLKAYSYLQESSKEESAAYATLLGHKSRWQYKTNAKSLINLSSKLSQTEHIVSVMKDKISEVHPLIGNFIDSQISLENTDEPQKPKPKPKRRYRSRSRNRSSRPKK